VFCASKLDKAIPHFDAIELIESPDITVYAASLLLQDKVAPAQVHAADQGGYAWTSVGKAARGSGKPHMFDHMQFDRWVCKLTRGPQSCTCGNLWVCSPDPGMLPLVRVEAYHEQPLCRTQASPTNNNETNDVRSTLVRFTRIASGRFESDLPATRPDCC